jgi:hypothetical protein
MSIYGRSVGGLVLAGAVLRGAGATFAANPDAGSTIYPCVQNGTDDLRWTDDPRDCRDHETAISWNSQGPTRPAGPPGPAGAPGQSVVASSIAPGWLRRPRASSASRGRRSRAASTHLGSARRGDDRQFPAVARWSAADDDDSSSMTNGRRVPTRWTQVRSLACEYLWLGIRRAQLQLRDGRHRGGCSWNSANGNKTCPLALYAKDARMPYARA